MSYRATCENCHCLHVRLHRSRTACSPSGNVTTPSVTFIFTMTLAKMWSFLCGRPIGRVTCLAHPSVRPSVCLSVRLSRIRARNSKKKRRKIKGGINVLQGTGKWSEHLQLKRSKVKVTGHQKPQEITYLAYMFTYGGRSSTGGSGADCKLGVTHC